MIGDIGHFSGMDRSDWFALYVDDGKFDDEAFFDQVLRGKFRLHPASFRNYSEGCVTIDKLVDWHQVKTIIEAATKYVIPGSSLHAYDKLVAL